MGVNILNTKAKDPTDAVFGIDLDGEVFHMPLSEGPHWIIAGQTGSGKSVFMNGLLISMFSHATPDELQTIWIDPKKVEATAYVDLPFTLINPVTDMGDAYGVTAYLCWLMDERYRLMTEVDVKKAPEFNDWIDAHPDEARERGYEKMKYIVLVVDEYADLVMQQKDVEKNLVRLGQKARAAAVHVAIATQRPSADVITPLLKANIPSRIALKVTDSVNSMIIIDEAGAEKLKGYGDGFVKTSMGEMTRVQGPFITNDEIAHIFAYIRQNYTRGEEPDWKQTVVDAGLCEWVIPEGYESIDDVPMEERHVTAPKTRFGR